MLRRNMFSVPEKEKTKQNNKTPKTPGRSCRCLQQEAFGMDGNQRCRGDTGGTDSSRYRTRVPRAISDTTFLPLRYYFQLDPDGPQMTQPVINVFAGSILVCSGCFNKININWVAYKQQTLISHSWRLRSPRSRLQQIWCLVRTHFLTDGAFSLCPVDGRGEGVPWGLFYKGTNLISDLITSQGSTC